MRIVIAHQEVKEGSSLDDQDVLTQAEAITAALRPEGHEIIKLPCAGDLAQAQAQLEQLRPDVVYNLVESLDGKGSLIHLFPQLLDQMKIPYTGSSAAGIYLTSNKITAKQVMQDAGLPTPAWAGPYPAQSGATSPQHAPKNGFSWIVKSLWEHASIGLDEQQTILFPSSSTDLDQLLRQRAPILGGACFAETFIDGREFNLSVLAGDNGPVVLSPAEILFEGYAEGMPRIVGYRAKWVENAYEYHHTPRRFVFPPEDRPLIERLEKLALKCWRVFGLGGYVRVDFRVDHRGDPWILEINTNPCLSPDAGFAAALQQSGIVYEECIQAILREALRKRNTDVSDSPHL